MNDLVGYIWIYTDGTRDSEKSNKDYTKATEGNGKTGGIFFL